MRPQVSFERLGAGDPLLLIHGSGMTRACWRPVGDRLARERELIVVDLPGHGASPLRSEMPPTPAGYALALMELLDRLGLDSAHLAGNSVGAWTALEIAKHGRARSVVAIAPAGLWPSRSPRSAQLALAVNHQLSRRLARLIPLATRSEAGRRLLLATAAAHAERIPADDAAHLARSIGSTRAFRRHLRETSRTRFRDGDRIAVPVTVVWGERERLLPKRARARAELPAHTRWIELPDCGHMPFWDAPELTAATILTATRPTSEANGRPT